MFRFPPERAILGLSVVCHGLAILQHLLVLPTLDLPPQWTPQYLGLTAASFVFSGLACASPGRARSQAAIAAQLVCLFLIENPTPTATGIALLLGAPLMIEIASFLPSPAHYIAGPVAVAVLTLFRRPEMLWGQLALRRELPDILVVGTTLTVILTLATFLRGMIGRHREALGEIAHLDSAIDRIVHINASFQDALTSVEAVSSVRERRRITGEIHDIVGYTLTNQQMMIEASLLLAGNSPGRLRELLLMARDGVAEGLQETRRILYSLRSIEEEAPKDLNLLVRVAKNFQNVTGVRVTVELANVRSSFDARTRLTLYRLIQESLINSIRHGKAKNVSIIFWDEGDWITVTIHDDGIGSPSIEEGIGLKGMRERVSALGGEMTAGNAPGGFELRVRLPAGRHEKEAEA